MPLIINTALRGSARQKLDRTRTVPFVLSSYNERHFLSQEFHLLMRQHFAGSLSIGDFRGDFSNLAALIQTSWSENNKQPLFYSADFLKSSFDYPGATFSLAPTLYSGSHPLAFASGFPRRARFKGRDLSVIVSTFLTVSPELKRK